MYYIRDIEKLRWCAVKELKDRLTWARESKGLTQQSLARMAKVSQGAIGNLESGLRKSSRNITLIAGALGVNPHWLADGVGDPDEGSMPSAPEVTSSAAKPSTHTQWVRDDEARLLDLYRTTDDAGRERIMTVAEGEPRSALRGISIIGNKP
jgi:transcriptional regulator with XRE-family HTH domain